MIRSIPNKRKAKKQKHQVYKIGLSSDKSKVSYHKKSESMTQAKMKQLINSKEISFHKIAENPKNTPYTTKYGKQSLGETKAYHAHHHSVALSSPQYQHAISSSTGSTRELKTVSNRVPKSKSKNNNASSMNAEEPLNQNIKYNPEGDKYTTINDLLSSK